MSQGFWSLLKLFFVWEIKGQANRWKTPRRFRFFFVFVLCAHVFVELYGVDNDLRHLWGWQKKTSWCVWSCFLFLFHFLFWTHDLEQTNDCCLVCPPSRQEMHVMHVLCFCLSNDFLQKRLLCKPLLLGSPQHSQKSSWREFPTEWRLWRNNRYCSLSILFH